jgi:hypothetical protein
MIYEIVCNITGERYIGSCKDLTKRMYKHKHNAKNDGCITSKQIIGRGNYTTKILDTYDDTNRFIKEQEWIEKLECINNRNAFTDQKEYNKKYNHDYYHKHKDANREIKKLRDKEYYQSKTATKIECECGGHYMSYSGAKSRHLKTKQHLDFV